MFIECALRYQKRLKPLLDFYRVLHRPQFVLEHILEVPARVCQQWLEMRGVPATGVPLTPARVCQQWLEMRGVPATGVPLTPQPVIVFGLTVYSTINHELYII